MSSFDEMHAYYEQNPAARWIALLSICLATFISPLSMSAVNLALPAIATDLSADAVLLSWVPTINLWGSILLMLPAGRLADLLGRKRVFNIGIVFFAASSLMVLLVRSVEWLLVVRILQGVAGALIFGTAMAIVTSIFTSANRGTALGFTATSVYLGLTAGPLIGGWLTEVLGWRSVFWVPVPFILISILLVNLYLKGDWKSSQREGFDWAGTLLFSIWTTALFFGLSGLPAPGSVALFLAGLLFLALFLRQQSVAPSPLIRLKALADNRIFNRSILASLFMYGAHYPVLFLLSLYLQYIQGMSPTSSGQLILIQALAMAILAPIAGKLSDRYQPRLIATTGCLLFCLGFAVLFWLGTSSSLNLVVIGLLLLGIGFGLFSTPNNNAAMSSVSQDRLSAASAMLNLARTLGNLCSMAIVVLLFNQVLGNTQLSPEQYPALMLVIRIALGLGCLYALAAAWFSYSRGNLVRS